MIATRTLPSSTRARPFELPLVAIHASVNELLANVQDALHHREPRGRCEEVDRPLQPAPGCEDETRRDDDDALRTRAEADVAAEAERLRLGPHVRHEERPRDRGDREHDRDVVAGAREDEPDRREHRSLAHAVGGRVEERAERRRLPAGTRERAVEDVEHGADDEDAGAEPVDEDRKSTRLNSSHPSISYAVFCLT